MQLPEATSKRWFMVLFNKFSGKAQKAEAQRLFLQGKKEEMEELLRSRGIFPESNMMISVPEIKVPEKGCAVSRETRNAIEERIFSRFGKNREFSGAFFRLFTNSPVEIAVALSKIRELFDLPDPSRCRPRKLVALFYAMITKDGFSGYAVTAEDFINKLEAIKEFLAKGKDPFEELKLNQYIEELIEGFRYGIMSDNY